MSKKNEEGIMYEGKHYTRYEASQMQRQIERSIRKTKCELIGADKAGLKDDFTAKSIKLRRQRDYYNDFSAKAGLLKQNERAQVSGYGRSMSGKALYAEKKAIEKNVKGGIIVKKEREIIDLRYICDLDIEKYKRVTDSKIRSSEVIITKNQVDHIIQGRGIDFYKKYGDKFVDVIVNPDYIFIDKPHTALACKSYDDGGKFINIVLRLAVTEDDIKYKNSIITAIPENGKRFKQRVRNNECVYKRE